MNLIFLVGNVVIAYYIDDLIRIIWMKGKLAKFFTIDDGFCDSATL